jgi:hypothetical protein
MKKILNFHQFSLNEAEKFPAPSVTKGEKIKVNLSFLEGSPDSTVIAYDESTDEAFSFLFGGDMMMLAKWDGNKWIS